MKNNQLVIIVVALIFGIGGFFGGKAFSDYQRAQQRGNFGRQFATGASGTAGRNRLNGRPVSGSVMSIDEKSLTVKMVDGSTRIVILPDSATFSETINASKSAIKVGGNIAAFGTDNTDGSITAQNIQLNPAFRNMGGNNPATGR
jgi:hypothetical protein